MLNATLAHVPTILGIREQRTGGDLTCRFLQDCGACLMRRKLEQALVCCCLLPAAVGKGNAAKRSELFELRVKVGVMVRVRVKRVNSMREAL